MQLLEKTILRAFVRAMNEHRSEVADHLLSALEAFDRETASNSALRHAYRHIGTYDRRFPRSAGKGSRH